MSTTTSFFDGTRAGSGLSAFGSLCWRPSPVRFLVVLVARWVGLHIVLRPAEEAELDTSTARAGGTKGRMYPAADCSAWRAV